MKVLLVNGSPRKNGNTAYATKTIVEGIEKNSSNTIEVINVVDFKVSGCIACDGCKHNRGNCVIPDDTKNVIDKFLDADAVIFATPVYWWGMSSQLKAVVDKFYSAQAKFSTQNKKIGVIAIGADSVDGKQYSLISDQFSCICSFLNWEKVFDLPFSASNLDDLQKSEEASKTLEGIHKFF